MKHSGIVLKETFKEKKEFSKVKNTITAMKTLKTELEDKVKKNLS